MCRIKPIVIINLIHFQIDFGATNDEIDFGDVNIAQVEIEDEGENNAQIDWGDIGEAGAIADISLEESGIVVADSGLDGGVARGEEAFTVLDSPLHRDQFIDEIYEVCCE